jgi:uroporphyrinogen decarboxylase
MIVSKNTHRPLSDRTSLAGAGAAPRMSSRLRVQTALAHREPDQVPVDFLATPEVWDALIRESGEYAAPPPDAEFFDPAREAVLQRLDIDCRVLSYDMFCNPPESILLPGSMIDWWSAPSRSTPNRMWRQRGPDDSLRDIWGAHRRIVASPFSHYEETATYPLGPASTLEDLRTHPWPRPDWWDFKALPGLLDRLDVQGEHHIRYRIGSVMETAWQLLGLERFMMDLASEPRVPLYVMDRIAEICLENTRQVLELAGSRLDMVYFYDDLGSQDALLMSRKMWRQRIRARHAPLVDLAHAHGKPVMYHTDGAVFELIPDLIDLGIDVLSPIQTTAKGMHVERLKHDFGGRLSFHGGVDIVSLLPRGTPEEVRAGVRSTVEALGKGGGYVLCSSHHLQPDTPVENIRAMYDLTLRRPVG